MATPDGTTVEILTLSMFISDIKYLPGVSATIDYQKGNAIGTVDLAFKDSRDMQGMCERMGALATYRKLLDFEFLANPALAPGAKDMLDVVSARESPGIAVQIAHRIFRRKSIAGQRGGITQQGQVLQLWERLNAELGELAHSFGDAEELEPLETPHTKYTCPRLDYAREIAAVIRDHWALRRHRTRSMEADVELLRQYSGIRV